MPLGQPPKDKFTVPDKLIDYSKWNEGKMDAMLADPLAAMTSIETALSEYIKNVNEYNASFLEYKARLEAAVAERAQMVKDKQDTTDFDKESGTSAGQTGAIYLNVRYYSLAALSMRRYVAGRLDLYMKARSIAHPDDPQWVDFQSRFKDMLSTFEQSIVPQLVAVDI